MTAEKKTSWMLLRKYFPDRAMLLLWNVQIKYGEEIIEAHWRDGRRGARKATWAAEGQQAAVCALLCLLTANSNSVVKLSETTNKT